MRNDVIDDKFETHEMTTEGINASNDLRVCASKMLDCINALKHSRETSLVVTKLEECVMWANKSIALYGAYITKV